jgi:SAM-dependent methyltransferase
MAESTFGELEHEGWLVRADGYDETLGHITKQAFAPILATFGDLMGKRFLDVACGTGHLAALAGGQGAEPEGLDFAATMMARARANYPALTFIEGNAEQLPYADGCFDAVACAFAILHIAQPDRAIQEAARVLRPGGRYTFTVWRSADQGGDFHRLVMEAIQTYGRLDVPLPPSPPLYRFAESAACEQALAAAGFTAPEIQILPLKWRAPTAQAVLDLLNKGTVRLPMILAAQTPAARERIHEAILEGAQAFAREGAIELNFPALLATAAKA